MLMRRPQNDNDSFARSDILQLTQTYTPIRCTAQRRPTMKYYLQAIVTIAIITLCVVTGLKVRKMTLTLDISRRLIPFPFLSFAINGIITTFAWGAAVFNRTYLCRQFMTAYAYNTYLHVRISRLLQQSTAGRKHFQKRNHCQ